MWWFVIFFIDLIVFLLFFIVLLSSIIFCFTGRKIFKYAFVPACINITAVLVIMLAPSIYRNKSYYKRTARLNTGCACRLYMEAYCVDGGGALSTDMDALYLTDSVNFRKYIGTEDEGNEMISVKCNGKRIVIEKTVKTSLSPEWNFPKILDKKAFSLKKLQNAHVFD